jgi:hypothetical protein
MRRAAKQFILFLFITKYDGQQIARNRKILNTDVLFNCFKNLHDLTYNEKKHYIISASEYSLLYGKHFF